MVVTLLVIALITFRKCMAGQKVVLFVFYKKEKSQCLQFLQLKHIIYHLMSEARSSDG